jgi:hypothetical protein
MEWEEISIGPTREPISHEGSALRDAPQGEEHALERHGEARGKPPRCCARLRDHMVSQTKWGSTYGETGPSLKTLPDGTASVRITQFDPLRHGQLAPDHGRKAQMNLVYAVPTWELPIGSIGCCGNHHLRDLAESISVNVGGPSDDANESGSTDGETCPKTSDASGGSQRGHSSRSAGKPRTGRRATPEEVVSSQYAEC